MDAEQDIPGGFALPSWRRTLLPSAEWNTSPARWWLLLPEPPGPQGLGACLRRCLLEAGQHVLLITPGPRLAQLGEDHWSLPPGEATDYTLLLQVLAAQGLEPDHLLHLWSLESPPATGSPEDAFARAQEGGFQSLLFLLQALGRRAPRPLSLVVLTHRMQALGDEAPCPERATLLGPVHAAAREYPHLTCRSVDVSLPEPGGWQETRLARWVLSECASTSRDGDVVYRGPWRHVRGLEPIINAPAARPGAPLPREHGVYLVLGGFGTLGASHAEALARRARARLVLVGRTPMPERAWWDAWLETHEARESISRRILQVRALEALGAEVRVVSADVADREQLQAAVEETLGHFGALHGVVFCVGTMNAFLSRSLAELTPEDVEVIFQSRIKGLYALEAVLGERPLDFCVLGSSLAAVHGQGMSAAHAAAMSFMDAFALRRAQRAPTPWMSVDWDGWVQSTDEAPSVPALGARPITPAEGAELFAELLSLKGVVQVTASPRGPVARPELPPPPRPPEQEAPPAELPPPAPDPEAEPSRPELETTYAAPRDAVEESIVKLWESMLGITGVGIYDNFFELGGDWRTGVKVMTQVREQTGVPLPPVSLQEGPTVEMLARRLRAASEGLPDTSFEDAQGPGAKKPPGEED